MTIPPENECEYFVHYKSRIWKFQIYSLNADNTASYSRIKKERPATKKTANADSAH